MESPNRSEKDQSESKVKVGSDVWKAPFYVVLEDRCGLQIMAPASTFAKVMEVRKHFGNRGYTNPSPVPPGGYQFPYDAHENFDWDMIGAKRGTREDMEKKGQMNEGVWFKGVFYRKRDKAATDEGEKIEMGARIWYSRAARENDPEHLKEATRGRNEGYVPLISFRGKGMIDSNYQKKP